MAGRQAGTSWLGTLCPTSLTGPWCPPAAAVCPPGRYRYGQSLRSMEESADQVQHIAERLLNLCASLVGAPGSTDQQVSAPPIPGRRVVRATPVPQPHGIRRTSHARCLERRSWRGAATSFWRATTPLPVWQPPPTCTPARTAPTCGTTPSGRMPAPRMTVASACPTPSPRTSSASGATACGGWAAPRNRRGRGGMPGSSHAAGMAPSCSLPCLKAA